MSATTIINKPLSRVSSFSKLVFAISGFLIMSQNCSSSSATEEAPRKERIDINDGHAHREAEPLLVRVDIERAEPRIKTFSELEIEAQQKLDNRAVEQGGRLKTFAQLELEAQQKLDTDETRDLTVVEEDAEKQLKEIGTFVGYGIGKFKNYVEDQLRLTHEVKASDAENKTLVLQKAFALTQGGPLYEILGDLLDHNDMRKERIDSINTLLGEIIPALKIAQQLEARNNSVNTLLGEFIPALKLAQQNEIYITTLKRALRIAIPVAFLVGGGIVGSAWAWYTWGR